MEILKFSLIVIVLSTIEAENNDPNIRLKMNYYLKNNGKFFWKNI